MSREVQVPVAYRDETGALVEETLTLRVGEEGPAGNVPPNSLVSGTWARFEELGKSRSVPGDWIPLAHVPLDLYPESDWSGCETEPKPRGRDFFEAKWVEKNFRDMERKSRERRRK